ncbi:MAG: nuclear transport factor 2 family protein [Deltaproteobacteria bacterium]|jgi:hypothetical protein|nr:nuclear transport factor 2 family protein [Deltaproteobacteria bacterium]MBW2497920.1 nuclear transport factor 2 family protein [Deltaproteobacteria bacterium]
MPMKPSSMTTEQMRAIARLHAEVEQRGDLEPLLETLVDEPIFEFHPPGGQLIGGETLRRFYTAFLRDFMPLVAETVLLGEWADGDGCVHEYQIRLRIDGRLENHQLTGTIYGSGDRIGGERLYGSPKLLDLMLGDFKRELQPIEGRSQWMKDVYVFE